MTCILTDTNVLLDVLLDRKPHAGASAAVRAAVESRRVLGMLPAHAVTTIHYLIRKEHGSAQARRATGALLRVFGVAAADREVLREALDLDWSDYEDAVTAVAARRSGCDVIVTRNPRDFRGSPVRVLTPEAALPLLAGR